MKRAILTLVLLAACQDAPEPTGPSAPGAVPSSAAAEAVRGSYIVVLRAGADPAAVAAGVGAQPSHIYRHALNGFAARLPDAAVAALRANPRVALVEADQVMTAVGTQSDPTWGLDRVDQRTSTLDASYTYDQTGAGVHAYILDTGIRITHNDFGTRASHSYDAIGDGQNGNDCNGHGTHVAGTVGGTAYGVAKGVSLHAVRVLDCGGSGTTSGVIAGIDWVTANHVKPAVANMSLGGGASSSLDLAVQNSIAAGVSYAVAAGNGDFLGRQQDACNYSPARVPEAITIGATKQDDAKTSWSNYGDCVDWFAPGYQITSAWYTSDTDTNTISGTSMATPHVAGAAALYLEAYPSATPLQVRDALYDLTTKGIVTSSSTANNHLLYTRLAGDTPPPGNAAPSATFTYACTDLACSFTDGSTDSDGSITAWSWSFGDGASSSAQHPSHSYASAGSYTVTLTVTDDAGATGTSSQTVSVTAPAASISLSASGYKVKGVQHADLTWSGATSTSVDVFRNGGRIATTANDGAYTDNIGNKGGGSYRYRVCEAGTNTCSNEVTVTF